MRIVARSLAWSAVLGVSVIGFSACGDKGGGSGSSSAASSAGKDKGGKIGSCNVIKTESLCREYGAKNVEAAGEDFLRKMCDGFKGEYKADACPKDKRVGSCVTQEGTKVFYSEGAFPMEAAAAEKSCKSGIPEGEWKAGQ